MWISFKLIFRSTTWFNTFFVSFLYKTQGRNLAATISFLLLYSNYFNQTQDTPHISGSNQWSVSSLWAQQNFLILSTFSFSWIDSRTEQELSSINKSPFSKQVKPLITQSFYLIFFSMMSMAYTKLITILLNVLERSKWVWRGDWSCRPCWIYFPKDQCWTMWPIFFYIYRDKIMFECGLWAIFSV